MASPFDYYHEKGVLTDFALVFRNLVRLAVFCCGGWNGLERGKEGVRQKVRRGRVWARSGPGG